jgi:hypothetical protein
MAHDERGRRDIDEAFEVPPRPFFVITEAEVRRWRVCVEVAAVVMGAPVDNEDVWMAARCLYNSDLPT